MRVRLPRGSPIRGIGLLNALRGFIAGIVGIDDINPTSVATAWDGMKEGRMGREGAILKKGEWLEVKRVGYCCVFSR